MGGYCPEGDKMAADYYYFKPAGKWKYEGRGESIPRFHVSTLTHDYLFQLNDGMPGIMGDGKCYTIVIIDPEGWPRMIPAVEK